MVIIPREQPLIKGLNSYYCDIEKLMEHYQGEIGTGGVHFHSPAAEAVIFFDKDEILGGAYRDRKVEANGREAVSRVLQASGTHPFVIDIYEMDPEDVYFWARIGTGQTVYRDLSTEFTDLEALINKMTSERLTGAISVSIAGGGEGGVIFLSDGEIIGGSYSWSPGRVNGTRDSHKLLVQKTKASGGTFHVTRISPRKKAAGDPSPSPAAGTPPAEVLQWLARLLQDTEALFEESRIRTDFKRLLKRRFIEAADRYPFLDPFAGEFEYADARITLAEAVAPEELTRALVHCLAGAAEEAGISGPFRDLLASWRDEHARRFSGLGMDLSSILNPATPPETGERP